MAKKKGKFGAVVSKAQEQREREAWQDSQPEKVPVVPNASDLGDMEADTIRYEERFGLRVSKQVEEMNRADERMYGPGHFGELSD